MAGHAWFTDGWFWPMWLWMVAFWAVLIWFGVWAVRRMTERSAGSDARRVLEERFARGEIDPEEFERRRRILEGGRPA